MKLNKHLVFASVLSLGLGVFAACKKDEATDTPPPLAEEVAPPTEGGDAAAPTETAPEAPPAE